MCTHARSFKITLSVPLSRKLNIPFCDNNMINNPRFPYDTGFNRDALIHYCFVYPLLELQSVTSTTFCHLQTMAEYSLSSCYNAKGHVNMASNE